MKKEFKPLEPCSVNGLKVKVLASNDIGYGFSSPCPQLYLTVQNKEVAVIGYADIASIRDMLNHALSNGAWSKPHTEFTEEELRERMETLHGKNSPGTAEKVESILESRRNDIRIANGEKPEKEKIPTTLSKNTGYKQEVAIHWKNYNELKAEGKLDPKKGYWIFYGGGLD